MAKGFGIAALVVAIVAIIVPLYGLFLSAGAVVLSVIAALAGDRIFATATPIIAGVNTLFLSPLMWMLIRDKNSAGNGVGVFYFLVIVFFVAPFVAMFLNSRGKVVI
jgi:dolichol kinase